MGRYCCPDNSGMARRFGKRDTSAPMEAFLCTKVCIIIRACSQAGSHLPKALPPGTWLGFNRLIHKGSPTSSASAPNQDLPPTDFNSCHNQVFLQPVFNRVNG